MRVKVWGVMVAQRTVTRCASAGGARQPRRALGDGRHCSFPCLGLMRRIVRAILDDRLHLRPSLRDVVASCAWSTDLAVRPMDAGQGPPARTGPVQGAGTVPCEIGPRSFSVGPFSAYFKADGDVIASIGGHANRHRRDR